MKKYIFRIISLLMAVIMITGVFSVVFSLEVYAYQTTYRPSNAGHLEVRKDGQLSSQNGDLVQLRGVSTHGLLYYPQFVDPELIKRVSTEWDANLLRLAMYSEDYCNGNEEESLRLLYQGIDAALDSNMYVIVDWHILYDNDPNMHLSKAVEFFQTIGKKYGKCPNIIYEICNEPNGDTTWEDIKEYANCIIPVIRNYNDKGIIIVGTPNYDRELECVIDSPLEGYSNIMYAFHFYASSHGQELRNELINAVEKKLPVFISESGISPESGDGGLNYKEITTWYNMVNNLNLSYAIWSLCNKDETSAMFRPGLKNPAYFTNDDLTQSGQFAKGVISGKSVAMTVRAMEINADETVLTDILDTWPKEWVFAAIESLLLMGILVLVFFIMANTEGKRLKSYPKLLKLTEKVPEKHKSVANFGKVMLVLTTFFSFIYLIWRVTFSIPKYSGFMAIACNVILLIVEAVGFIESLVHYLTMIQLQEYELPQVTGEYPDVDVFVATYNEPVDLLRKTVYACTQMDYPDKSKVHIYICDDKRRPQMQALAEELGVNYFDRIDNKGAKAGNLNAALARTSSPYIVTFDADMKPMKEFLMQTIPYFMDAEVRNAMLPKDKRMPLGFVQTPQSFHTPDVFQFNLYNENRIPNEQDFFYRTIEPAKTQRNCVIYGGSNTVLSREALNAIGGFYTETITEDFATGLLIESAGFISLGLSTPLASGLSATTFKDHIQQRTRWGRGVISTAKHLKYWSRKELTPIQKMSYWSSVFYWYSPVKNLIYILSPLMYAIFMIPIFVCSTQELFLFWLPMLISQTIYLPFISRGSMSYTWSGIQEISVMPSLLVPILKETFGISLTSFKVTDKNKKATGKEKDIKSMIPFFVLIAFTIFGIVRVIIQMKTIHAIGLIAVLFWLLRSLYFCIMSLFLIDGRTNEGEDVVVKYAHPVTLSIADGMQREIVGAHGEETAGSGDDDVAAPAIRQYDGITTRLTEHNFSVFLDEADDLRLGQHVDIHMTSRNGNMDLKGVVIGVQRTSSAMGDVFTVEVIDFCGQENEYIYDLYNRVPSLPQDLKRNLGPFSNLWINFTHHLSA